jgi:hypothetical protein
MLARPSRSKLKVSGPGPLEPPSERASVEGVDGEGVGLAEGVAELDGVGLAEVRGLGDGLPVATGVGVTVGSGVGVGATVGSGVGVGATVGKGVGVATGVGLVSMHSGAGALLPILVSLVQRTKMPSGILASSTTLT